MADTAILITVTGRDRPGITATLTGILAESGAALLDIEQVVVQGQLTLCFLVTLAEEKSCLKELLFASKALGVDLDFKPIAVTNADVRSQRYVITVLGHGLGAVQLHTVS